MPVRYSAVVSEAIGAAVVAVLLVSVVVVWRLREGRRMRDLPRDDTRRVGAGEQASPSDAAIRAGTTAWTRLSGP